MNCGSVECTQVFFRGLSMNKSERDAEYYQRNKERIKARTNAYYHANTEAVKETQKARYARDSEKIRAANKAWAAENKDKMRAYHREYVKRNRDKWCAQTALYRASKKAATPSWVDMSGVRKFYEDARRLKEETGREHHVDHIVPLQSPLVCGLHVPANLQVLPGRSNRVKSNKIWPDMP